MTKADSWEIYHEKVISKEILIENGKIKLASEKMDEGFGVRVIADGKVGFASGNNLSERLFEKALKLAKQESLKDFAYPEKIREVKTFDRKIERFDEENLREMGEILAQENIASGIYSVEVVERDVRNSNGVELNEKESYASVFVEAVYDKGSSFEFNESKKLFNPESYVEKALELAKIDSKAEKIESKEYTITLSPIAIDQLLSHSLYPAFYYENVKRGRSKIAELMGKEAFKISLIDNPHIDFGLNSCSFDDEGVATKKTELIKDGVVSGYLTDLSGEIKTGNGFRDGYDAYPSIAPSNVVLDFDEKGECEGIYIHSFIGSHTANYVSGDFSVEIMNGIYDGRGIRGAMIYGNIYDFLNRIVCVGKEYRQVGYTLAPEVTLEDVKIRI